MGTRHLICVVSGGEYRVAQYGQWDGYPSGQGLRILDFLKTEGTEKLEDGLRFCRWITDKEEEARWAEFGIDINGSTSVSFEVYEKFCNKYPEMNRDTSADILKIISDAEAPLLLKNDLDFAQDGLFCEYVYVIDLDKNTFEVYEGFNKEPLLPSERFYTRNVKKYKSGCSQYYPAKLIAKFSIVRLPSKTEFLKACGEEADE